MQDQTQVQTNQDDKEESLSERLQDQNIFELLGIADGTDQEKEAFLDEVQQVIWEDFLENDLELMVTEEEYNKAKMILDDNTLSEIERQERIINYLEQLIPDLEGIMLDKALELKEEMVKERLIALKKLYSDDPERLAKIEQIKRHFQDNLWRSGCVVLNTL